MERRDFLKGVGAVAVATTIAPLLIKEINGEKVEISPCLGSLAEGNIFIAPVKRVEDLPQKAEDGTVCWVENEDCLYTARYKHQGWLRMERAP